MRIAALAAVVALLGLALTRDGQPPDAVATPFHPRPSRITAGVADGDARLLPERVEPAAIGSYELRIRIGAQGVASRGALLVAFPKAWFTNPFPIPKRLQISDRGKPPFVGVTASRGDVTFEVSIDTVGLAGKIERFNQTIRIVNAGSPLAAGDVVSVTLANTTAPYVAGSDAVRVAVDADATGRFILLRNGAEYVVSPAAAEDFTLVAPTEAVVGRPIELRVTAFDRFWNVATTFAGSARLIQLGREQTRSVAPRDHGSTTFTWTPAREGFYFPQTVIEAAGRNRTVVNGNPIRVLASRPATPIYWGELHSHSSISPDGIAVDPFPYARDAARLDFFAPTEHADDDGTPRASAILPDDWSWIQDRVRRFNEPDRFVTLLAYECSFPAPSGHHNVFFRTMDGMPWPAMLMQSIDNLWARIRAGDAITVPHHTGISFAGPTPGLGSAGPELQTVVTPASAPAPGFAADWSTQDPVKRPLLEIYSLHGASERYAPDDALSYENLRFTFSRSIPGAHYARDAWAAGLEVGVVAATDNHTAQPGQPHGGITAVRASRLTRESIFDALAAKHTYATTGQRMYIDLVVADTPMGGSGRARSPVRATVIVAAPSDIATAELIRLNVSSKSYTVAAHWDAPGRLLQTSVEDRPEDSQVMYYLRVQLKDPLRGRVVRGWTSPIWITLSDGSPFPASARSAPPTAPTRRRSS